MGKDSSQAQNDEYKVLNDNGRSREHKLRLDDEGCPSKMITRE